MTFTLVIPPEIAIPDSWKPLIFAQAAGSEKRRPMAIGETCELGGPPGTLFMMRQDETTLVVSKDPLAPAWVNPGVDYSWAKALWEKLLAGADTPEGRRELAHSMLKKGGVPCGECKTHWREVLKTELNPDHLATPEAWRRWVWDRRQDIAASKGRPVWELPAK